MEQENRPKIEKEKTENQELILENIFFESSPNKDGSTMYFSSASDRKRIVLERGSLRKPSPGKTYRVRVLDDSDPGNPMQGKMTVEIVASKEEEEKAVDLAKEAGALIQGNEFEKAGELIKRLKTIIAPESGSAESVELREIREIFGVDFLGPEEAVKLTDFPISSDLMRLYENELIKEIKNLGLDKEKLKQLQQENFMIVCRQGAMNGNYAGYKSITIRALSEKFQNISFGADTKKDEDFINSRVMPGWAIVKKSILGTTRNLSALDQGNFLNLWADAHKIDPTKVAERSAAESCYDSLLYLKCRGIYPPALYFNEATSDRTSNNRIATIILNSAGLHIIGWNGTAKNPEIGVCPQIRL